MTGQGGGKLLFAAELSRASSVDDLTQRLYAGIDCVFDRVAVGFDLLDPETHRLRQTSARGVSDFFLARYDQVAREADPVLNYAIASQKVAYNLSMFSEAEWRDLPVYREVFSLHRMVGLVYAPVVVAGKVVATLNLSRGGESGAFAASEMQSAKELSQLLGSLLESLLVRERLEREHRLFQNTLESTREAVVISDLRNVRRYANRAAREVLDRQPPEAPHLDEAIIEMRERKRSGDGFSGLVQRVVEMPEDDAFVAFLRGETRVSELPKWLPQTLTPRETEVVELVVTGLRDAEISEHLHLSVHTVKGYLREVYRKLGIRSRVELVRMMIDAEIETPLD